MSTWYSRIESVYQTALISVKEMGENGGKSVSVVNNYHCDSIANTEEKSEFCVSLSCHEVITREQNQKLFNVPVIDILVALNSLMEPNFRVHLLIVVTSVFL